MQTKYDVIVAGGGFAGFAAACAAAREGCRTLLVERNGFLGGAAGDALVLPFMRYSTRGDNRRVNAGLFLEVQKRLGMEEGSLYFREEELKIALEDLCAEYGVTLLYHTEITGALVENGVLTALDAFCAGRHFKLYAPVYIDATGDANLAGMAGCGYELGDKGSCQPMTLCFRMANIDMEGFEKIRRSINPCYWEDQKKGLIRNPRENVLLFHTLIPGVLHFNTTRIIHVNPTDPEDLTRAEREGRQQVMEMVAFLKRHFECFAQAQLIMTAARAGVRESRLIHGEYTLTEDDVLSGRHFESGIARSAYKIDIHNPGGTGTVLKNLPEGVYYTIPFETCIPKEKKNLLVAGRCISATHAAQSSFRIMPVCCCIGEGAGIGAALFVKKGVRDLRMVDPGELRAILQKHGALC